MKFDDTFSDEKIIYLLCKIRLSGANKRHKKQFYRNISPEASSPHTVQSLLDGRNLLPPRRKWKRPCLAIRKKQNTFQTQLLALRNAIRAKDQGESWRENLKAFIQRVQSLVLRPEKDYEIKAPHIYAVPKDKAKQTYRAITAYQKLEDYVVIALTAKYFRLIFDFSECSYMSKGHHSAVQALLDYRNAHDGQGLYVAEVDIQRFFDVLHHDVVREALKVAISRAQDKGIDVDPRALLVIDSYLNSYNTEMAKEQVPVCFNEWPQQVEIGPNVGVPQGGALSSVIADLVLDGVDRMLTENPDPDLFYARFCDDMILIHPDRKKCTEAFEHYRRALESLKLPVHPPVRITEFKDYHEHKSKSPFVWGEPNGGKEVIPRISFLGYEIRYDGTIGVREASLKNELEKQVRVANKVIQSLASTNMSKAQILHRTQNKLISMSVGRIRLGQENQDSQYCWSSGFKLLRENKHFTSQLKRLDGNRGWQISRVKRRLENHGVKAEVESQKTKRKLKLPKYYGAPFSYYRAGNNE